MANKLRSTLDGFRSRDIGGSNIPYIINTFTDPESNTVQLYHIPDGTSIMGESRSCDIQIKGHNVHPIHCALIHERGSCHTNLKVLTGSICVNHIRHIKGTILALKDGDVLMAGKREFTFYQPNVSLSKKKRPEFRHTKLSKARLLSHSRGPKLARKLSQSKRKTKSVCLSSYLSALQREYSAIERRKSFAAPKNAYSGKSVKGYASSIEDMKTLSKRATPIGKSFETKQISRENSPQFLEEHQEIYNFTKDPLRKNTLCLESSQRSSRIFPGVGKSAESDETDVEKLHPSQCIKLGRKSPSPAQAEGLVQRQQHSRTFWRQRLVKKSESESDMTEWEESFPLEERVSPIGASQSEGNGSSIECNDGGNKRQYLSPNDLDEHAF